MGDYSEHFRTWLIKKIEMLMTVLVWVFFVRGLVNPKGGSSKKLGSARKRLNVLFKINYQSTIVERKKILREMDGLLIKEEIMWKQRSCLDKMKWRIGIQFFFIERPLRELRRTISAIRRSNGSLTNDLEEIKDITNSFFKQLYSCDASVDPSHIISLVKPRVTDDMNDDLCKPFTEK